MITSPYSRNELRSNSSGLIEPIRSSASYLQKNPTLIKPHQSALLNKSKKDNNDISLSDKSIMKSYLQLENKIPNGSSIRLESLLNSHNYNFTDKSELREGSIGQRDKEKILPTDISVSTNRYQIERSPASYKLNTSNHLHHQTLNETISARKRRLGLNDDSSTMIERTMSPRRNNNNMNMDNVSPTSILKKSRLRSPFKKAAIIDPTLSPRNYLKSYTSSRANSNIMPYTQDYVDQLKAKHANELSMAEAKYKVLTQEFERYKAIQKKKEEEYFNRMEDIKNEYDDEIKRINRMKTNENNILYDEYEQEIRNLKNKNKELEHEIYTLNYKLNTLQSDLNSTESTLKIRLEDKTCEMNKLINEVNKLKTEHLNEIQTLTETYDKDKKKMKDSYETLINELSIEIKQIYEKMNNEKDTQNDKIIEFEHKINQKDRIIEENRKKFTIKLDESTYDLQKLTETNKHQKRLIDENTQEITRLTFELDDKKKKVLLLETRIELLEADKKNLEQSLREYRNERLIHGIGAANHLENTTLSKGLLSPVRSKNQNLLSPTRSKNQSFYKTSGFNNTTTSTMRF